MKNILIGLDISTSTIGLSIFGNEFNDEYKLINLSYISFSTNKNNKSLFNKLDQFVNWFKQYELLDIKYIFVEAPLKKFQGKFSNADTIQLLNQFNSLISGYLYKKYNIEPIYYNSQTARNIAFPKLLIPQKYPNKKHLIWNEVMKLEPQINWEYSKKTHELKKENFDMSDAYVVGLVGIADFIKNDNKSTIAETLGIKKNKNKKVKKL